LLRDDIENELFHHLSRDGGEADWPVVPWEGMEVLFDMAFKKSRSEGEKS